MQVASSWLGLESLRKGPPRAPSSLLAREVTGTGRHARSALRSRSFPPCSCAPVMLGGRPLSPGCVGASPAGLPRLRHVWLAPRDIDLLWPHSHPLGYARAHGACRFPSVSPARRS